MGANERVIEVIRFHVETKRQNYAQFKQERTVYALHRT